MELTLSKNPGNEHENDQIEELAKDTYDTISRLMGDAGNVLILEGKLPFDRLKKPAITLDINLKKNKSTERLDSVIKVLRHPNGVYIIEISNYYAQRAPVHHTEYERLKSLPEDRRESEINEKPSYQTINLTISSSSMKTRGLSFDGELETIPMDLTELLVLVNQVVSFIQRKIKSNQEK